MLRITIHTMKKLMSMALIVAMGAVACQKEGPDYSDNSTPTNGGYLTFSADFVKLESKTAASFDESSNTLTLAWEEGDQVGIYSGQTPILFTASSAGATTTLTSNIKVASAASYSAVYPYMTDALMEAGALVTTVPAEQIAKADTPKYHVAVAKTASNSLAFKNVTAAVRLNLMAENVTKIELKANGGENISGVATVNTSNATVSALANGSSVVTLVPAAGVSTIEPGIYYASVVPQTLSQGFTVTYHVGANTFDQTSEESLSLDGNTLVVCEGFGTAVEGSQSNPFTVGSVDDLKALSNKLALDVPNYVKLVKDIDMSGITEWTPISNSRTSASVPEIHFDGNNRSIKNFAPASCTAASDGTQAGFFGTLCGSCKNLTFTGVAMAVTSNTSGVLAGFVGINGRVQTIISNVSLSGSMSGNKVTGGLCGNITNALVENSTISLKVSATDAECGGFAGRLESNVKFVGCSATGEITGSRAAGCFAGGSNTTKNASVNVGKIEFVKCSATGNVTGTYQMGAFVGHIHTEQVSMTNCYATGNVTTTGTKEGAAKQIGGLVGVNAGANLTISNCYYTGKLNGGYIETGGLLGVDATGNSTIKDSFAIADLMCHASNSNQNGGIVGCARATSTTVSNCYAAGTISSQGNVGAVLGETTTTATVTNCKHNTNIDAIVGAKTESATESNNAKLTEAEVANYATASKIATTLGWSTEVWDLSGNAPVLK